MHLRNKIFINEILVHTLFKHKRKELSYVSWKILHGVEILYAMTHFRGGFRVSQVSRDD